MGCNHPGLRTELDIDGVNSTGRRAASACGFHATAGGRKPPRV